MAGLTRLELATFRVTGERSNQTELQPHKKNLAKPEEVPKGNEEWLLGQDSNLRPND